MYNTDVAIQIWKYDSLCLQIISQINGNPMELEVMRGVGL